MTILIADSGSTKSEWCLLQQGRKKKIIETQGASPYFLNESQLIELMQKELVPGLKNLTPILHILLWNGLCCSLQPGNGEKGFKKDLSGSANISGKRSNRGGQGPLWK